MSISPNLITKQLTTQPVWLQSTHSNETLCGYQDTCRRPHISWTWRPQRPWLSDVAVGHTNFLYSRFVRTPRSVRLLSNSPTPFHPMDLWCNFPRGTPKSMAFFYGFSIIKPFSHWGTRFYGNPHIAHVQCMFRFTAAVSQSRTSTSKSNGLLPTDAPPCPNRYHLTAEAKSQGRRSNGIFKGFTEGQTTAKNIIWWYKR